jgi:hypothetical protein
MLTGFRIEATAMPTATTRSDYDARFYAELAPGVSRSANVIVPIVLSRVHPTSVVDVGCGVGGWLKVFHDHGVVDLAGFDGDHVARSALLIEPPRFRAVDLSKDFSLDRTFDLAVSLEVAEHLPASRARPFIRLLTGAAPAVLFSAAIPGQGGTGHVNEQWQDYWRALFRAEGYLPVDFIRPLVRGLRSVEPWYQQNVVLYGSPRFLAAHADLEAVNDELSLNQVHPDFYQRARAPGLREIMRFLARRAWPTLFSHRGSSARP